MKSGIFDFKVQRIMRLIMNGEAKLVAYAGEMLCVPRLTRKIVRDNDGYTYGITGNGTIFELQNTNWVLVGNDTEMIDICPIQPQLEV